MLAAVEAACTEQFNIHGLLCTTYYSGPLLIVNGPLARKIGMASGHNVLGQGNRANATIGRALQFVPRQRLFPCTNCGLAPMSREVAVRKLEALAKGAALARERYGR